jgi:hypothetical protein
VVVRSGAHNEPLKGARTPSSSPSFPTRSTRPS